MNAFREMTVGELMDRLREYPAYQPVTVVVNGTAGVITGVWSMPLDDHGDDPPHVLIGEQDVAPQTVPDAWTNGGTQ